jgi:hypothetical protein
LKRIAADKRLGIFEDVPHLLKTIRYRFVKTANYCILPFAAKPTINRESWRSLGMSNNLLSDSQAHKQKDELVMIFVRRKFLVRAIEAGKFDFFLCLRPWILLKHAIFVEGYFLTERTIFLTLSFAILLAPFHLLIEQKKCRIAQDEGKKSKEAATQSETRTVTQSVRFNIIYWARNRAKRIARHWITQF